MRDLRRHFNEADPGTRAALLERMAHGDPNAVNPAKRAHHTRRRSRRCCYLRAANPLFFRHPAERYACQISKAGFDRRRPGAEYPASRVGLRHEIPTVRAGAERRPGPRCRADLRGDFGAEEPGKRADAPSYCLDPKNGIETIRGREWRDADRRDRDVATDPCPLTGTHVDVWADRILPPSAACGG